MTEVTSILKKVVNELRESPFITQDQIKSISSALKDQDSIHAEWFFKTQASELIHEELKKQNVAALQNLMDIGEDNAPAWYERALEYQYRKGVYHGVIEAAREARKLYKRGGYIRPTEISNMIETWGCRLRSWKAKVCKSGIAVVWEDIPRMAWDSWKDIKQKVIQRDGAKCLECGSDGPLECHHVVPVSSGGIPTDDNLETLCETCHNRK